MLSFVVNFEMNVSLLQNYVFKNVSLPGKGLQVEEFTYMRIVALRKDI